MIGKLRYWSENMSGGRIASATKANRNGEKYYEGEKITGLTIGKKNIEGTLRYACAGMPTAIQIDNTMYGLDSFYQQLFIDNDQRGSFVTIVKQDGENN